MTVPSSTPQTMTVRESATPAAKLPYGLVDDVSTILAAHGLHAPVVPLIEALAEVIGRTPVGQGGTGEVPS